MKFPLPHPLQALSLVGVLLFTSCFWDESWAPVDEAMEVDADLWGAWQGKDMDLQMVVEPGEGHRFVVTQTSGGDTLTYEAWRVADEDFNLLVLSAEAGKLGLNWEGTVHANVIYWLDGDRLLALMGAPDASNPPYETDPREWLEAHRPDLLEGVEPGDAGVAEFSRVPASE